MIDISGHLRNFRRKCGFINNEKYISVNCCGYQKFVTMDYKTTREKGRLDYQIIYIIKGKGIYRINGMDVAVPEGNIVVYKPGQEQVYSYSCADSAEALPLDEKTIALWFSEAGYEVGYIGKWHLASTNGEFDFRTSAVPPERRGG